VSSELAKKIAGKDPRAAEGVRPLALKGVLASKKKPVKAGKSLPPWLAKGGK
jgi:hypothetical protein